MTLPRPYICGGLSDRGQRTLTEAWTNHHRFLLDVAYRLLGSDQVTREAYIGVSVPALRVTDHLISRVYVVSDRRKLVHVKAALERHQDPGAIQ
jgi:hypothetical protein